MFYVFFLYRICYWKLDRSRYLKSIKLTSRWKYKIFGLGFALVLKRYLILFRMRDFVFSQFLFFLSLTMLYRFSWSVPARIFINTISANSSVRADWIGCWVEEYMHDLRTDWNKLIKLPIYECSSFPLSQFMHLILVFLTSFNNQIQRSKINSNKQ